MRRWRPDLINERYNLFHLAGTWVAKLRRVPLLLEVNGPLAEERARFGGLAFPGPARKLEAYVWRSADKAMTVTGVLKSIVEQAGVPADWITVVPNGIDPARFAQLPRRVPTADRLVMSTASDRRPARHLLNSLFI